MNRKSFNNKVAINELDMMKENLIAGIAGVVFCCAIVILLLIFAGYIEWGEPTNVSDNVKAIDITIDLVNVSVGWPCLGVCWDRAVMNFSFRNKDNISFFTFDDGHPCIKLEPYRKYGYAFLSYGNTTVKDYNAYNFTSVDYYWIDIPAGYYEGVNVTITLPNGKSYSSCIEEYSPLSEEMADRGRAWLYSRGYKAGEKDARIGYSAKIPWDSDEYYRDGYIDGYIGATPRYTYSPIRKTITIE